MYIWCILPHNSVGTGKRYQLPVECSSNSRTELKWLLILTCMPPINSKKKQEMSHKKV